MSTTLTARWKVKTQVNSNATVAFSFPFTSQAHGLEIYLPDVDVCCSYKVTMQTKVIVMFKLIQIDEAELGRSVVEAKRILAYSMF